MGWLGSSSETEFSRQEREIDLFSGLSLWTALLAHKTNQNGLREAVSSGPVAPDRCHGRLDHRTSTMGKEKWEGTQWGIAWS